MSTWHGSKTFRCLEIFQNLKFIQGNGKPDLDRMRIHVLDCLNALLFVESMEAKGVTDVEMEHVYEMNREDVLEQWKFVKENKKNTEESIAKQKVFVMAVLMSLEYGGNCDSVVSKNDYTKHQLLEAFPDDAKTCDCR
jgi:uncharacterized protein (DUF433 family)